VSYHRPTQIYIHLYTSIYINQRLPKPRPTRSSRLLQATQAAQIQQRAEQEEAKRTGVPPGGGPLWTMPRWRKAAAKINQ